MNEDDHLKNPNKCKKISIEKKKKTGKGLIHFTPFNMSHVLDIAPLDLKSNKLPFKLFKDQHCAFFVEWC